MMRGALRLAATSHCLAIGITIFCPVDAQAQNAVPSQQPSPPPTAPPVLAADGLDPNSPLAELPDFGVAWPNLDAAPKSGPASLANAPQGTADGASTAPYSYRVDGLAALGDIILNERFEALSTLREHQGQATNAAQLDRRAREDTVLLQSLLRSAGYYDAHVTAAVELFRGTQVVVLSVEAGEQYRISDVSLGKLAQAGDKAPDLRAAFGLKPQDALTADAVIDGRAALVARLGEQGFPFAKVSEPEIVIDHANQTATLVLSVDPGGERRFGKVVAAPSRLFNARHIQDIARFRPGQIYNSAQLDDLRRALVQTGIVSSAEVTAVEGAAPGTVDVAVALQPAPLRTIAGAFGYGTGEGVRAEASWTHRNLFPPEGALTVRAVAGTQEQSGGVIYRRNNFHDRDRVLTAQLSASNVQRPSFQATTFSLSGSLERQTTIFFQKAWAWSAGAELAASDERDVVLATGAARRRTYFITALPTGLTYDGSDDLLNPAKGFRLGLHFSPELSLEGAAFAYARSQVDASVYRGLGNRLVLAGRVRLGFIAGAPRDSVAPSRRFYAGGGASIRGYGFQAIGPRDVNNDPIGGRSLTELSLEARIRLFGSFGIVPFVDAGNIYTSPLPRFTGLQYGGGVGVRYYSSFGPIRIDVGTPINPKPGDSRLAVYVSLGQAF
ncbi:MAG: autotransporter assembly complex family protein [Sphingomonas sp.]|jgi:translocation and assembly module TamA